MIESADGLQVVKVIRVIRVIRVIGDKSLMYLDCSEGWLSGCHKSTPPASEPPPTHSRQTPPLTRLLGPRSYTADTWPAPSACEGYTRTPGNEYSDVVVIPRDSEC